MDVGAWLLTTFHALVIAILLILALLLIVALIVWAIGPDNKSQCCSAPATCPVWLLNPRPDARTFALARVDGSIALDNGCATGSFTIQRTNHQDLLYTITTPPDTVITDIYTLEVACVSDFPLTSDGCAVDLTAFHHQSFDCLDSGNIQTFTSTLNVGLQDRRNIFVSVLVVFSDDTETCLPVQMMTISGRAAKPIALTGNCTITPCPPNSCCDPIIPNFIKTKLSKCIA